MTDFNYAEMTTRNRGFVTDEEQEKLRAARVFIPGVGGMGGAAFMALVRSGVGKFMIADIDRFDVSNLNRQMFATLDAIGQPKAMVARAAALRINPEAEIRLFGSEWTGEIDALLASCGVVVNGMDDAAAGVHLYRRARVHGLTVIDAYASPLPSVTSVAPAAPRPEERLGYPTIGTAWDAITPEMRAQCLVREVEYVLTHSSSHRYVDIDVAAEVAAGKRSRFSFSTMVTMAGTMMADEAIRVILGRKSGTDHRGYFFNPHRGRVERPLPAPIGQLRGFAVRRFMRRMMG
jgi:hypothetical protein